LISFYTITSRRIVDPKIELGYRSYCIDGYLFNNWNVIRNRGPGHIIFHLPPSLLFARMGRVGSTNLLGNVGMLSMGTRGYLKAMYIDGQIVNGQSERI
jgi:hypothetical protein